MIVPTDLTELKIYQIENMNTKYHAALHKETK
jgi:hypothetical protein